MKRVLLLLVVAAIVWYLMKSNGLLSRGNPAAPQGGPVDRARTAARASEARASDGAAVAREREADQAGAGVTENMTPDQVRALLGPPDDVATETAASGGPREIWTYRNVGKAVVFENGVVVSVR